MLGDWTNFTGGRRVRCIKSTWQESMYTKKQYISTREKMQKADHGGLLGFNATIRKAQPGI